MEDHKTIILGAGMTGLAAGYTSGNPIFEAEKIPGGICSSYYINPDKPEQILNSRADDHTYRFDTGGGHWIFGGDPVINHFLSSIGPIQSYDRLSSVYFHQRDLYVPYPIQNNLAYLDKDIAAKSLAEMANPDKPPVHTMGDWLYASFGKTLVDLFFAPFHQLYTAGLWDKIAPQDSYKSPVNFSQAVQGAFGKQPPAAGYNTAFLYPANGLDGLTRKLAEQCRVNYDKRAVAIDTQRHTVSFSDGSTIHYENLISTLPLNRMMEMTNLKVEHDPDPYSSVLVLNIGAQIGKKCPPDHWLYNPDAKSGFHRVGFYSNVDASFLPAGSRQKVDRVNIYVERAYPGSQRPSLDEINAYTKATVRELQDWNYIGEVETADPSWIDIAYTWARPGSRWREQAIRKLQSQHIYPIGRYARWVFQGIADSLREGFVTGSAFRQ